MKFSQHISDTLEFYITSADPRALQFYDIYDENGIVYAMNSGEMPYGERKFMPRVYINRDFSVYVLQQTSVSPVIAYFRLKRGML